MNVFGTYTSFRMGYTSAETLVLAKCLKTFMRYDFGRPLCLSATLDFFLACLDLAGKL